MDFSYSESSIYKLFCICRKVNVHLKLWTSTTPCSTPCMTLDFQRLLTVRTNHELVLPTTVLPLLFCLLLVSAWDFCWKVNGLTTALPCSYKVPVHGETASNEGCHCVRSLVSHPPLPRSKALVLNRKRVSCTISS